MPDPINTALVNARQSARAGVMTSKENVPCGEGVAPPDIVAGTAPLLLLAALSGGLVPDR